LLGKSASMLLDSRKGVLLMIINDRYGKVDVKELVNIYTVEVNRGGEEDEYGKFDIHFQFRISKNNDLITFRDWVIMKSLGDKHYLDLIKTWYKDNMNNTKTKV